PYFVLIEGAGSPAEVNLRAHDIANMGFAEAADVPVILVGDIDRGGVIAQVAGTHLLLSETEKARTKGYLINKFRGDLSLFDDGIRIIDKTSGLKSFGVLPYFADAHRLPPEDAFSLTARAPREGKIRFAVPVFSRIANFDDLDPLLAEPDVSVQMVRAGEAIPAGVNVILLPGSKATLADMDFIREQGWDIDIKAHVRQGGTLIGLCAGYQMLGRELSDPGGIEGSARTVEGLGLLDLTTVLTDDKKLVEETGTEHLTGAPVRGYHMHVGRTEGPALKKPFLDLPSGPDGAISKGGRVMGGYLHGLFASDEFRNNFINRFKLRKERLENFEGLVEETLDKLADHMEKHLDLDAMLEVARGAI
ncbi:MAG: cobyric acid synthase, partial [Alphaproteobacteria bacterium]